MSTGNPAAGEPSEEELRAAYEAQVREIRVEHVLLEDVVTLINLGMRRTGLVPGTESERDPEQVRLAIEAVRSILPLLEAAAPADAGRIRDALSQLQLAYVRLGEQGAGAPEPGAPEPGAPHDAGAGATGESHAPQEPPNPGDPGPAQRSGRLWVPGQ
jgi:hypothetical protein